MCIVFCVCMYIRTHIHTYICVYIRSMYVHVYVCTKLRIIRTFVLNIQHGVYTYVHMYVCTIACNTSEMRWYCTYIPSRLGTRLSVGIICFFILGCLTRLPLRTKQIHTDMYILQCTVYVCNKYCTYTCIDTVNNSVHTVYT